MKRLCISLLLIAAANFSRAQYTGSSNDGFSNSSVNNQNPLPNIYRGGNNNYVKSFCDTNQGEEDSLSD